MTEIKVPFTKCIKVHPRVGANVLNAADMSLDMYLDNTPDYRAQVDQMLASLAGSGPDVLDSRNRLAAALAEPILQMVPYATLYDQFFMPLQIEEREDPSLPVEDQLVGVGWESHMQTGVQYVRPGYLWYRPSFKYWTSGIEIPWNLMNKAGWNVLSRQMNYTVWDMAKKQDAVAKAVIDAAIPNSHKSTVATTLTKAAVDAVLIASSQIGFPVKQALINPGILMSMQGWTWGGTGFFIPPERAQELLDNLFISTYGNIKWYASPYVPTDYVYFAGDPQQVGWHETRGTPRNDSAVNITEGIDQYTIRSAEHSFYAQSGLSLWRIQIT